MAVTPTCKSVGTGLNRSVVSLCLLVSTVEGRLYSYRPEPAFFHSRWPLDRVRHVIVLMGGYVGLACILTE